MPRRKSIRQYSIADVPGADGASDEPAARTRTRARPSTSSFVESLLATTHTAPTSVVPSEAASDSQQPPAKRRRATTADQRSPLSGTSTLRAAVSASSSFVDGASSDCPHPRVSLARLPADVLLRIAELLVPSIQPTKAADDQTSTRSDDWIDHGRDLVRYSSTCRAVWSAVRHLVGRSYGCDVRSGTKDELPKAAALGNARKIARRLMAICADDEYEEEVARARTTEKVMPQGLFYHGIRTCDAHEYVPASRIRHLYLAFDGERDAFFRELDKDIELSNVLCGALPLCTNLESVALVWRNERAVVSTSPYSLAHLPADILIALAAHPSLKSLYLCGVKFLRTLVDGSTFPADDSVRFQPQFRSLTLNACHDSALELITLAPGLKEIRAWRDFARQPRIEAENFWSQETWKTVERADLTGFSGQQGARLLLHCLSRLVSLRSLSPPVSLPLRTLRLSEPYGLPTLKDDLLPALAHLPHLKHFTCLVWNDRNFGPSFLEMVHEAMPDLEELGVGLENEGLNWWQGSLAEYAVQLKRFQHLHTFTWNYSPYADLDFPETQKHALPLLYRSLLAPMYLPPSFRHLKWFRQSISLRLHASVEPVTFDGRKAHILKQRWKWSDDPVFERKEPRWAVEALREKKGASSSVGGGGWSAMDGLDEMDLALHDSVDASTSDAEDAAAAKRRRAKGKGKAKAKAKEPGAVFGGASTSAVGGGGARGKNKETKIVAALGSTRQLSITELLKRAEKEEVTKRKGKQKAVPQATANEEDEYWEEVDAELADSGPYEPVAGVRGKVMEMAEW
ncbi:hypothetical protein JCM8097_007438 [Rhodosporidiobolus ruineniae]